VFLVGEEGTSQGLKPAFGAGGDVQAKAWTYHKGKGNSEYEDNSKSQRQKRQQIQRQR
jgi:hypothetical protein